MRKTLGFFFFILIVLILTETAYYVSLNNKNPKRVYRASPSFVPSIPEKHITNKGENMIVLNARVNRRVDQKDNRYEIRGSNNEPMQIKITPYTMFLTRKKTYNNQNQMIDADILQSSPFALETNSVYQFQWLQTKSEPIITHITRNDN